MTINTDNNKKKEEIKKKMMNTKKKKKKKVMMMMMMMMTMTTMVVVVVVMMTTAMILLVRLLTMRHEMGRHGGCNAALENTKAVQKQIRILENRLDQALQKFNQAIAANRSSDVQCMPRKEEGTHELTLTRLRHMEAQETEPLGKIPAQRLPSDTQ